MAKREKRPMCEMRVKLLHPSEQSKHLKVKGQQRCLQRSSQKSWQMQTFFKLKGPLVPEQS